MSPPPTYQVSLRWKGAPMERDAHIQRLFFNISSRVPSEEAPPRPLHIASSERETSSISESTWWMFPPPGSPNRAPIERDAHLQSLFYIYFRVPSKGAFPPGSLQRAPPPQREREREREGGGGAKRNPVERDAPFPQPPIN
jgi:hypothetical protein